MPPPRVAGRGGGPRLLSLAELEELRDELAARVSDARRALSDRTWVEDRNRRLIEEMMLEPERHKWRLVSAEDIGEPRLQALARAPALRPRRHADELVARRHQLGLPVSHLNGKAQPQAR